LDAQFIALFNPAIHERVKSLFQKL